MNLIAVKSLLHPSFDEMPFISFSPEILSKNAPWAEVAGLLSDLKQGNKSWNRALWKIPVGRLLFCALRAVTAAAAKGEGFWVGFRGLISFFLLKH